MGKISDEIRMFVKRSYADEPARLAAIDVWNRRANDSD